MEQHYEKLFIHNRIEEIFKEKSPGLSRDDLNTSYLRALCHRIAGKEEELTESAEGAALFVAMYRFDCWQELPFFQMCKAFGRLLKEHCTENGRVKVRFGQVERKGTTEYETKNPFLQALYDLKNGIRTAKKPFFSSWTQENQYWGEQLWWVDNLSEEFIQYLYDAAENAKEKNPFCLEDNGDCRAASNWLRLLIQLTAKEKVQWANKLWTTVWKGFLYTESGGRRKEKGSNLDFYSRGMSDLPAAEDWWTKQIP